MDLEDGHHPPNVARDVHAHKRALAAAVVAALASSTCGGSDLPTQLERSETRGAPGRALASAGNSRGLRYAVRVLPGGEELAVDATIVAAGTAELSVDDGVEPYVRDVATLDDSGAWIAVAARGTSWFVPACESATCRIRYRFLLGDAARTLDDSDTAMERGGAFFAPPSSWLLAPLRARAGAPVHVRVETPPGTSFVTGAAPGPAAEAATTFVLDVSDVPEAPFSAFGPLDVERIDVPGGRLEVAFARAERRASRAEMLGWVESSARAVAAFYGRFPMRHAAVLLVPTAGSGLGFARTLGNGGASILAPVGVETEREFLADDWVMVHEMVHLAFPNLARRHIWLEEGLATYVEPIARARSGLLSPERVWRGLYKGLPRGLPGPGDRGLDNTPTWGRTYWGGALFCLLADIRIREASHNERSLGDALRAILQAGGDVSVRWPLERALETGDRATGTTALTELHAQMGASPHPVDLADLFQRLGVSLRGDRIAFDDAAPLAGIRRAITAADRGN